MHKKINLKVLVGVSALVALEIILSRFLSIATPIMKIGFGFVPIAVCALLYGPVWAGVAGALADFLGATLFPIGPYFPGFTLSAALTGVVFGLFLYRHKGTPLQVAGAVAVNCIGISLLLTTYWLSIIMDSPFMALLPTRVLQAAVMLPLQYIVLRVLQKPVERLLSRQDT